MGNKVEACCENCKFLHGNSAPDAGWKPCEIASMFKKLKWELCASFCAAYNGPGITPWQEPDEARKQEAFYRALLSVDVELIAELQAENKALLDCLTAHHILHPYAQKEMGRLNALADEREGNCGLESEAGK